jgi:hypothetical protein
MDADDIAFLTTGTLMPSGPRRHVRTTRMTATDDEGWRKTVATTRKTLPVHMSTAASMTPRRLFFLECLGLEPLVPVRASVADEEHLRVLGTQSRL